MSKQRLASLRRQRLDKLAQLEKLGIAAYPDKFVKRQNCNQARKLLGHKVKTAGRITAIRGHGGLTFMDLSDESGTIQLWFQKKQLDNYRLLRLFDIGDFLGAEGRVAKTKAGEISINVESFRLLSKALRPLPSKWYGLKDVESRNRRR